MNHTDARTALAAGLALCLGLAGCGDGLSKGSLAKTVDEVQRSRHERTCWSVQRVPAQLLLTIGLAQAPERHPILGGLLRAGLISASVGQRALHEVVCWTEPAQERGTTFTCVTYTWKLADLPKWVKPEHFAEVEGMTQPVESSLALIKTSDGWRSDR